MSLKYNIHVKSYLQENRYLAGMEDVSCSRVVRIRDYVDYDYLSDNFYVWEGTYGRVTNAYLYNRTTRGISPAETPGNNDHLLVKGDNAIKLLTVREYSPFHVRSIKYLYVSPDFSSKNNRIL